ncbi:2-succinyl-6-hydroxy-2,4-cyclohexadiene-1-carboxylate synthase [Candidatus Kapabacteria bacterium]|nr:2-succinyl-6-hydroxy-2,4-cyclohexadiene-1-carboxylate synthase [Candidatus Kapabacteria bacterium]
MLNYKTFSNLNNQKWITFLHGFMGSSSDWNYFADNLKTDYNILLIDLPAHGESVNLDKNDYLFANIPNQISDILEIEKIKSSHLVGYSMGGRIAIKCLINFPEIFEKVILESTTAGIESQHEREARKQNDKILGSKIVNSDFKEFLDSWYQLQLWGNIRNHKNYSGMINSRLDNNLKELQKSLEKMGTGSQPSYWDSLKSIKNSIIYVSGNLDQKYTALANKFSDKLSYYKHEPLAGVGHNVHFENNEIFLEIIKNHFGD